MCGIASIFCAPEPVVRDVIPKMVGALRHRGPDAQGIEVFSADGMSHGLGHARLSILDLSPAGAQPMKSPITGACIVFNGEIYNYLELRRDLVGEGCQFQGGSDTEVLLAGLVRHGPDYLHRLKGMFAFVFFDGVREKVLVARDPLGIKPLYWAAAGRGRLFASEVRALQASGLVSRDPHRPAIASYLAYGAVPEPFTIFRDIRSFPAGCYQVFRLSQGSLDPESEPVRYWNFPAIRQRVEVDAAAAVRSTLRLSVEQHLISDVPVGVFLSSGIDSTVVAALAAGLRDDLRSFTVGFDDHEDLSEIALAESTARSLRLKHENIRISSATAESAAMAWMESLDQPSMDGMNVFLISKAVRDAGVKVALSGQGGDELFGGYPSFSDVPRLRSLYSRLAPLPVSLRRALVRMAFMTKPFSVREKAVDMVTSDGSLLSLYLHRRRTLSNKQMSALGIGAPASGLTQDFLPAEELPLFDLEQFTAREAMSLLETRYYLGNMLLRDGDANSMAHSLEMRVPFLDTRVVDLALSLPEAARFPAGTPSKHLLRVAFASSLRPELLQQSKRGFTLPIRRWMLGTLRDQCESGIERLKADGLLEPRGVDGIWRSFCREPESPAWTRAWSLCVLGDYIRRNCGQ